MKRHASMRAILLALAFVVALATLPGAAATAAGPPATDAALPVAELPDETRESASDAETADTVVGANETVDDDITAITGDVVVRGTVRGDVTAAAGSVRVTGEVTGEVSAASRSVSIGPGATVGEEVSSGGGSVVVPNGARVEGTTTRRSVPSS